MLATDKLEDRKAFTPARVFNCALAGTFVTLLVCSGCASMRAGPQKISHGEIGAGVAGQPILPEELDELTRAFADRYVGLLSSTCDALKKDNPDPVQRREAQELMLDSATNVYDIASNADAFTRMLDLVVVTTLLSQVWVDDDRAGDLFGERGEVLIRALHHGRGRQGPGRCAPAHRSGRATAQEHRGRAAGGACGVGRAP